MTFKLSSLAAIKAAMTLLSLAASLPLWAANTATDRNNYRPTVAVGNQWSCAIRDDREVVCWGYRQDPANPHIPKLRGISDAATISMSFSVACAVTGAGKVYCFGVEATPVEVVGISSAVAVLVDAPLAGSDRSFCALLTTGKINCWGDNSYGQLGDGTYTDRSTPVEVLSVSGAVSLASASSSSSLYKCAVRYSGEVRCWGGSSLATPQVVLGSQSIRQVAMTMDSACLLNSSGKVLCASLPNLLNFSSYAQVPSISDGQLINSSASGRVCVTDSDLAVKCFMPSVGVVQAANTGFMTTLRGDSAQLDFGIYYHGCAVDSVYNVLCMGYGYPGNCDITLSGAACHTDAALNSQGELGLSIVDTAYAGTWYPVNGGLIAYKAGKPILFTAPSGLARDTRTTTSLTISWDKGSTTSSGFDVRYRVAGTSTWLTATGADLSAVRAKIVISGLVRNTSYEIRVRGKTWASYTDYSSLYTTSTLP